ncbi:MAG: serine protease, partial [Spirochaetaceae bacterium]|nr:serine protease [Spirochaetaceae bacterium]
CAFAVFAVFSAPVFSQSAGALRDYVGLINQSYHPDIVAYFEKMKADLDKRGEADAVKAVDLFLKGDTGSGFVISDARGNFYIVTNHHVVAQAYSLSITFERQDGFKRKIDNLKIIADDEEQDLALLAFAPGDKPAGALSFLSRSIQEGEDVYSAGFPGLGVTPLWQFGRGMVSNAIARFPKSIDDETMMGPFIQHTAQVDPGNSGGPLLVAQRNVPAGYAVAGVNTLSALWRQAANYAIPANTVQAFVGSALNSRSDTWRAALDERLSKFVEGLGANKAVYPHIAGFLSSACVGENAEYAISELFGRANRTVQQGFIEKCEDSVVGAMGYAVAWTIENSIRGQGAIRAALKDVSGGGEEYTVVFTVNNKDFSSRWVREYGNWRIRTFGEVASGDKTLVEKKEKEKKTAENLRTDSDFNIEAGYAYLFEKGHALYASATFMRYLGARFYFAGSDFWAFGIFGQIQGAITIKNIALMPYVNIGADFQHDKAWDDYKDQEYMAAGFPLAMAVQGGLKVTTAKVPGLYGGMGFQYNVFSMNDNPDPMKMALITMVGYSF